MRALPDDTKKLKPICRIICRKRTQSAQRSETEPPHLSSRAWSLDPLTIVGQRALAGRRLVKADARAPIPSCLIGIYFSGFLFPAVRAGDRFLTSGSIAPICRDYLILAVPAGGAPHRCSHLGLK